MNYDRTCEHCNAKFVAKMPHARFCPDKPCKQNFHKSKHQAEKDASLEKLFKEIAGHFEAEGLTKGRMCQLIDGE